MSSTLGGKRYCGDRDALSWKCCGVSGTRTECETWGLCVLGGGGGRRYCGDRAGAAVNIFGAGEEGAGVRCAAGLSTSFGGKSSCGERVAAGTNICVQGVFPVEVLGSEVSVAGGGGRRYCGESVGALVCVFGVIGGLEGGVDMEVEGM